VPPIIDSYWVGILKGRRYGKTIPRDATAWYYYIYAVTINAADEIIYDCATSQLWVGEEYESSRRNVSRRFSNGKWFSSRVIFAEASERRTAENLKNATI